MRKRWNWGKQQETVYDLERGSQNHWQVNGRRLREHQQRLDKKGRKS